MTATVGYLTIPQSEGEQDVLLENGNAWRLGRAVDSQIRLPSELVSRQHALVQRMENGEYYLLDLGSRNGTFLNGTRVTTPMLLNDGDRISFGDFHIGFHCPKSVDGPADSTPKLVTAATTVLFMQKMTSVLVVDVKGFTKIAQVIEPQQLSLVIGTLFRSGGEIMRRHGSWGQKYIGDALMSVWVHTRNGEGFQILSILHALGELIQVVDTLQEQFQLPFPIGVGAGINTGPAAIGNAGSEHSADYTALGNTVNAAFRFESATREIGFDIVIGRETMEYLKQCVDHPDHFFEEKSVHLKGYEFPAHVWAATFPNLRNLLTKFPAPAPPTGNTATTRVK
ncbi:MAG: adenylate/guanylate cyclase domain-containing protein [Terracidiphilus sp.]|jgi:adenylate cyclase